jgi:acetyl-CoA/propionyl-CoA carboxylase biotin carboxyl carrier protein
LGHAIEVRINAEDAAGGRFSPSPGTLTSFTAPSGPGVRLDAGYEAGDTVSQFYDNLIAKLIVWGPDRDRARRRLLRAIGETTITGVATTLPADVIILSDDEFINGTHSTKWVETNLDFSSIPSVLAEASGADDRVRHEVLAEVNGKRVAVSLFLPESSAPTAPVAKTKAPSRRSAAPSASSASGSVLSAMQGTIVKVAVEVGQSVAEGETVAIVEAMKMENPIVAPRAGVVASLSVQAGDSVAAGAVIAELS